MKKSENIYSDAALMKKALLGEADEAEQQELAKRLAECAELQKAYEQLQRGDTLKDTFESYGNYSSEKAYDAFLHKIGRAGAKAKKKKSRAFRIWGYVAAAAVALAVGLSFYLSHYAPTGEEGELLIQPGVQQAQLTLPDGSVIDMQEKEVNVVVDGVRVNYKEGVLSYQSIDTLRNEDSSVGEEAPVKSNELVIPRGGENCVILADGTIVHLNAGSRLTYPVRFTGKRRMVLLEGEGYFRVKDDSERPFVVRTNWGDIMVYGTEFNVNAYKEAKACYTTLVRGKVSCTDLSQKSVILSPGEQAVLAEGKLEKYDVDVEEYIGWVKGEYVFADKPLGEIMQTFERWYNVDVYYETPSLRNLTYSGNLKRYNTINTFLDALEMTGDIYFKINGRNILIYENE